MSDLFTVAHVAQLHEIQKARLKRGLPGIGPEVEELIARLTSGGVAAKTDDPRVAQAKVLWDKGFGRKQGFDSFDDYLAHIPAIPEEYKVDDERFPFLVLVDARIWLITSCELAGLRYDGDHKTFDDLVGLGKGWPERVYWIRCHDGRRNRGKDVKTCRKQFAKNEQGLVAIQGVALYIQYPDIIRDHYVVLAGSVLHDSCDISPWLGARDGGPKLFWDVSIGSNISHDYSGCGSCRVI